LGNMNLPNLKELLYFKESLSVLLISILFILLSANIDIEDMRLVMNWNTLILFLIVVLVIRPLAVFASSSGSTLKLKEKLFISWVGPRGIVAAGIASLFGEKLVKQGVAGAEYITPLVFTIVLGTVLLNATTARLFAKLVKVFLTKSEGVLIIGASQVSRLIADYLNRNGRHVALIDSNQNNIKKAKDLGLRAISTSIYSDSLFDDVELNDIGYLMALTGNPEINKYAINKFGEQFGENGSFRLVSKNELRDASNPKEGLFSNTDDYNSLASVAEQFPMLNEVDVSTKEAYEELINKLRDDKERIPIFIKDQDDELTIITSLSSEAQEINEKSKLVYLGKEFS